MNAEAAYLFRHALLREAAYQLHLPGQRARLHAEALAVMERQAGGRPAELLLGEGIRFEVHPTDPLAEDLADHARLGGAPPEVQALYACRAAALAERQYRPEDAMRLWEAAAGLLS
ncbi:MAG: hypothetical protein HUU15_03775, partial [Candidatus Brocadiae bacterium]|nr:hypothetical protein [Candidatus Brocadiia bacterium]